jgi:hypothetical protein
MNEEIEVPVAETDQSEPVVENSETHTDNALTELDSTITETLTELDNEEPKEDHPSGFKKRIERFNRRLSEKEQEIEYWKKEALKQKQSEPVVQTSAAAIPGKPKFEDYNDITEYTEKLTDWKLQEALQRRTQEVSKQSEINQYQSRVKEFAKDHPDYDEVLQDAAHIPAAQEVHQVILESEVGPKIAYHLANNTELFPVLPCVLPLD